MLERWQAAVCHLLERVIPYDLPDPDDEAVRALERRVAALDAQAEQRRYVLERERHQERGRHEGEQHVR